VLRRRSPKPVTFGNVDRLVFAGLYRLAHETLDSLKILKRRRSSVGIALVFEPIGIGNRDPTAAGQRQLRTFASSFMR
jgi:hypothetical protein